jgi:5-(carboxyamino)imidazole ribonucleotide mutase
VATDKSKPLVGVLLGSKSDWDIMQYCAAQLEELNVPWEAQAISAHRAPDALFEYLSAAVERGLEIIIAAAGGAAHLPGVCAAKTPLPVLGVPMESPSLKGLDSLLSIVQMPGGVPVGTLAIGRPGAINAALLAVSILGLKYPHHRQAYEEFRKNQTARVLADRTLKLSEQPPQRTLWSWT